MNPRALLKFLMERDGMNPTALARVLRESGRTSVNIQPNLSKWQNDPTVVPLMRTMAPVADFFGVLVDAFYDPTVAESEFRRINSESSDSSAISATGLQQKATSPKIIANINMAKVGAVVPLISWVQAGKLNGVEDHYYPGEAEEWVVVPDVRPGGRSFALRVAGDSMTSSVGDSFPEGTVIIVDPDVDPTPGRYVIAKDTLTNEATFKRLMCDGGRWFLRPLNAAYPTIEIDRPELRVIGVVVQKQMVQRV